MVMMHTGSTGAGSTVLFEKSDNSTEVSLQSDKGKFTGSSNDLQIYHNGTVSRIDKR